MQNLRYYETALKLCRSHMYHMLTEMVLFCYDEMSQPQLLVHSLETSSELAGLHMGGEYACLFRYLVKRKWTLCVSHVLFQALERFLLDL